MKYLKMLLITASTIIAMSSFAHGQSSHPVKKTKQSSNKTVYTCSMHPEVSSNKPGKCPKCRMKLVATKKSVSKEVAMKTYTCPMHADVTSKKPGKCPKCNMDLVETKKAPKTVKD
ncbi:MAG: heavy metal-binding domain-containing protein [Ferruginibacter sp.]